MFKKRIVLPILMSLLLATPVLHASETVRPPIATVMRAFSSIQNIKVWTLRVGQRTDHQALVQITGVDHEWNNLIQKMQVEKTFKDVRYSVLVDGKPFVALIVNNGIGELHLPGESDALPLIGNSALASEGNAEHFLTDYLKQSEAP